MSLFIAIVTSEPVVPAEILPVSTLLVKLSPLSWIPLLPVENLNGCVAFVGSDWLNVYVLPLTK